MDGSRARGLKTRKQRVRYIAEEMAAGRWLGSYLMKRELAKEWRVKEDSITNYAGEAHRLVAFTDAEKAELRRTLAGTLTNLLKDALADRSEVTGLLDVKGACEVMNTLAKFAGLELEAEAAASRADVHIEIVQAEDRPVKVPGSDPGTSGAPVQ